MSDSRAGTARDESLPDVLEAVLDGAALAAWLDGLEREAECVDLRLRPAHGAAPRDAARSPDVPALREGLAAGAIVGAQVRYRCAGREIVDTLLRAGADWRLVRMMQPLER